jgi:outer membrane protein assembly factor BamB
VPNKPVPVVRGDLIFMVSDGGVASCVDRHTGDVIWNERIGGTFSASPLLAGDRLYCLSEEGKTVVLAAGREFKVLAENQLTDGFMASPAVDGNALILRTKTQVYRVE